MGGFKEKMNSKRMRGIKIFIGTLLSLVIILFLFRYISFKSIIETIKTLRISSLIIAFLIYFLIYILRAVRFKNVSDLSNLKDTFSIVCIHNFLNNVLPFKSGELSYPLLIKNKFGIKASQSISDLVLLRFFDLISLGLILLISLLAMYTLFGNLLFFSFLILLIAIIIFLSIYYIGKKQKKIKFKNKSLNKISKFISLVFFNFSNRKGGNLILLFLQSIVINILMFIFAFVLITGLGLNVPLSIIIFGGALSILATLLPIQGLFNLGTLELGWIFPLVIFGVPKETAISISFSYHIITLLLTTLLFLVGLIIFYFFKKKS